MSTYCIEYRFRAFVIADSKKQALDIATDYYEDIVDKQVHNAAHSVEDATDWAIDSDMHDTFYDNNGRIDFRSKLFQTNEDT